MTTIVNRPGKSIESSPKTPKKQGSSLGVSYIEIKKLKKLLKSKPKQLWKYLQKREK